MNYIFSIKREVLVFLKENKNVLLIFFSIFKCNFIVSS